MRALGRSKEPVAQERQPYVDGEQPQGAGEEAHDAEEEPACRRHVAMPRFLLQETNKSHGGLHGVVLEARKVAQQAPEGGAVRNVEGGGLHQLRLQGALQLGAPEREALRTCYDALEVEAHERRHSFGEVDLDAEEDLAESPEVLWPVPPRLAQPRLETVDEGRVAMVVAKLAGGQKLEEELPLEGRRVLLEAHAEAAKTGCLARGPEELRDGQQDAADRRVPGLRGIEAVERDIALDGTDRKRVLKAAPRQVLHEVLLPLQANDDKGLLECGGQPADAHDGDVAGPQEGQRRVPHAQRPGVCRHHGRPGRQQGRRQP
mmetsp:Transcript_22969/g.72299  ORF Transcript_22969/g.72299 Transcript_22969/m.72299 type:complete len:318 (+) Transcript_22969:576-1529(+)